MKIAIGKKILSTKGLKNEMTVAFGLIALCLLAFAGYLFPGVSSYFQAKGSLFFVVVIVCFILAIVFHIIYQWVEPVIRLNFETKKIAEGDYDREIHLFRDDELGQLGESINRMTKRMRENVEELKKFSQTTEHINAEINKRIVTLSNMLQISNLIAQNVSFKEIVDVGVGKCLGSGSMNFACLILKDFDSSEYLVHFLTGPNKKELLDQGMGDAKFRLGEGYIGRVLLKHSPVVIEKETPIDPDMERFRKQFGVQNVVISPITSKGNAFGVLISGNDQLDFVFTKSEQELVQLVARQIGIAYANEILHKEIQKLEVKDRLTGLFNENYLRNRLAEEIKRAMSFQRPCSLVLLNLDNFRDYHSAFGHISAENVLIKIGHVIQECISETDKASRSGDHEFAVILPEKNKKQSIVVADNIRRRIEALFVAETDLNKKITCTGAVTENPLDGVQALELIDKGREILKEAQTQGGNRICYKV